MKMPFGLILAGAAGVALAAPLTAQDAPTATTVVATVNGTGITLGEMIIARSQLPPQYQELPDDVLFDGVLEQLIQQQVLADTLGEDPMRVTIALDNERRLLRAGEVVQQIVDDEVTDENIQAVYDGIFADSEGGLEYNAAHILVATVEEAEAVLARLEDGEEFAALAQELSTDLGSGANGGDLGWFGPGMMVAPFEEAVMGMEVGDVSGLVETQFGQHIIALNDTREMAAPALDTVRDEITAQVREEAIATALTALTEEAEITMPDSDAFDPAVLSDLTLLQGE